MTKTLTQLLNESPEYMTSAYSRNGALGFRGTKEQIERAYNLFLNYYKSGLRLRWINDGLAFIAISPENVREAIKLYLYVNLLHSKEVPSRTTWDEETGIFTLIQDIGLAEKLSNEGADEFMALVQAKTFIPLNESTSIDHEYKFVK